MDIPKLPAEISSDGREVWDWARKLSEASARAHKIRELRSEIARIGTRCGDCDKWMKSRECPKEHNVKGWSRGPSSEAYICLEFLEKKWATDLRNSRMAELVELEKQ